MMCVAGAPRHVMSPNTDAGTKHLCSQRGLVPTLQHTHPLFADPVTVIESALVVQYVIDAFPHLSGHVLPAAKDAKSAYARYTINLLTDTWFNKVNSFTFKATLASGTDEAAAKADELFDAISTHIEPKLAKALGTSGTGPFVGGAERMTLFEVSSKPHCNATACLSKTRPE